MAMPNLKVHYVQCTVRHVLMKSKSLRLSFGDHLHLQSLVESHKYCII